MWLRKSTASQSRMIGPFVSDSDFKTVQTGLTIANTDVKISINGAAGVSKNSGGGTHRNNGDYSLTFDATDTGTVGEFSATVVVAGALPVKAKWWVLEAAVYDELMAASAIGYIVDQPVNTTKVGGTSQTARDLGASVLLSAGTGTGQLDFTSGVVKANATQWLGGTIPAVNVTGVPLVDLKYTLGTISPAAAGSVRADAVTGAVGSVTGAVGSVTGAVGSVTGNVGGNVTGSVGSVVGAVGSVTGNVGGNVTGSVASVVGNVGGNVTGSVASVVGTVGGNVTGSVGSVVGAVGSVTGNIGGNLGGTLTSTERTAIADALLDRNMGTGTDSGSPSVRTVRQALRFLRNKWSIAAGTITVCKEDDATSSWTGTVTTTAGNPVSTVDPA